MNALVMLGLTKQTSVLETQIDVKISFSFSHIGLWTVFIYLQSTAKRTGSLQELDLNQLCIKGKDVIFVLLILWAIWLNLMSGIS